MRFFQSVGFCVLITLTNTAIAQLRVVVLSPELAENVFAIGAGDRIVGRIDSADYPDAVKAIPSVGDYQTLNAEKILTLAPDRVLAWSGGNTERQLSHLESLGLTVIRFKSEQLSDFSDQLTQLGELFDREPQAKTITDRFSNRLDELSLNARSEPVTVFYQLWNDPLITINGDSWISESISLCGGSNVFSQRPEPAPQVSIEAVISTNPDVIVGSSELTDGWASMWSPWTSISAVSNQRIVTVNADQLHRLTLRTLVGIESLCDAINLLD